MDILETLKQKREVHRKAIHPLASFSLNEKYTYCFGLAILAKGNMKIINELNAPFKKVCLSMGIEPQVSEEMIVDINNHFDQSFDYLIQVLSIDNRISLCFMIDLLKLSEFADWGAWYADEIIKQFTYLLKMSDNTMAFLNSFMKESKQGDSANAHGLVERYRASGNDIDYELLYYMNENYRETRKFDDLILDTGGVYRIESPTTVSGDIIVTNGSMLYISNTNLKIGGQIRVNSGRIDFQNSLIEAVGSPRAMDYLIELEKMHQVSISECTFDLHHMCAGIRQRDGRLRIEKSYFYRSQGGRMIAFSGRFIECIDSEFEECLDGGLIIARRAEVEILRCNFTNCRAEHGGAFHSATTESVHIRECNFKDCYAQFIGAAVYFEFKRYGQDVVGCSFEGMEPKKDETFNVYRRIDD
ncbi:MAG: hypothetical protein K5656_06455 [Lachnospiraceae bacterium]|nr:hypothetical protein [Lachnospiraceae bacterium]